ncbi:MAG: hypothetical protein JWQ90_2533 [Hydrocarboniphaga sp.]|uniref:BACON domain-containing protein n=1 Tax=Hydrocarboniphaga sp. TaxID=2033016 RepID=UPI002623A097|nr:hypothetical protein [Hydrocarboniphaga sp.]MDB5970083.1 hypothetical protein [Hydrocarboniphaga sp.]
MINAALRLCLLACLLLGLPACGGGGSSGTSISISPKSLTFNAAVGQAAPAPQIVAVHFSGDGVIVGYPPGTAIPAWLMIQQQGDASASAVSFAFSVADVGVAGTYSTTVRFVTGHEDGSNLKTVDMPVTLQVVVPFDATAPAMSFGAVRKSAEVPSPSSGYSISIQGSEASWTVSASQPWLSVSPTSGRGAAAVSVKANTSDVAVGANQATVTVTDTTSGASRVFDVSLDVRAAKLVVSPQNFAFSVDSKTTSQAMTQAANFSDELGGTQTSESVNWQITSVDAAWLKATPTSGGSAPATSVSLSLVPEVVATLPNGAYQAAVTVRYDNDDASAQTVVLPVSLDLRLPSVNYVGPYLALAGKAGSLYVRGQHFADQGGPLTLIIGASSTAPIAPDSDTQLRSSYPALAAGRYPVTVNSASGLQRGQAELVTVAEPAYAYASIPVAGIRSRLIYDAERQMLWAVNQPDSGLERYQYQGGGWTTLPEFILAGLTDAAVAPDGKRLVMTTRNAIQTADLTADVLIAQEKLSNPDPFCGGYFNQLAALNDGKFFIVFDLADCSGFTPSYLYDDVDGTLVSNTYFDGYLYNGLAAASRDGSRVYAGSNGVSPAQSVFFMNALNNSISTGSASANLSGVSVSGTASKVVLQNADVYSGSLSLLGHVPGGGVALASNNGARAFVYVQDDKGNAAIEVYDLNGTLTPGAVYPLLKRIALADQASVSFNTYTIKMASSLDDKTVFVAGDQRILVVPIN